MNGSRDSLVEIAWEVISLLTLLWMGGGSAQAQSPHEVLVLVNRNHPDSIAIANAFVQARKIPPINVVELDLPREALAILSRMSLEQFREWVWIPANQAMEERGLGRHVWAWVYSAGFPLRCTEPPGLSLTGITFSRATVPDPTGVGSGRALSPLFAGLVQPDGPAADTASPFWTLAKLGTNAPLPSMVLGHTGARGTTLQTALEVIDRGLTADSSRPRKPHVVYITSKDIRSTCRAWQFQATSERLNDQGVHARVTPSLPPTTRALIGLQCGQVTMWESTKYPFAPGAMAEHLTSFAGAFWVFHQSKLSYWLRKGATASCGTVVEPGAVWTKFPHARFYEHYTRGVSMLESFCLSVASPFQLVIIGEPLAHPFAEPLAAEWVANDPDHPFTYRVEAPVAGAPILCQFLLDGRPLTPLSPSNSVTLSPGQWPAGDHELRVAISTVTPVRRHTQLMRTIRLGDQSVHLSGDSPVRLGHRVSLQVESTRPPSRVRIVKGASEMATHDGTNPVTLDLDSRRLGLGPSPLHAEATFPDGRSVRSAILWIDVVAPTDPLKIRSVRTQQATEGQWTLEANLSGLDPVTSGRLTSFRPVADDRIPKEALGEQPVKTRKGTISVTPGKKKTATILVEGLGSNQWESLTTTIGWKDSGGVPQTHTAGIVFNYRDWCHDDFFGMHRGDGWVLATREGNDTIIHDEWGMPIFLEETYPIELEVQHPQGIIGRFAGLAVLRWEDGKLSPLPAGLMANEDRTVEFTKVGTRLGHTALTSPSASISLEAERKARLFLRAEQSARVAEDSVVLK